MNPLIRSIAVIIAAAVPMSLSNCAIINNLPVQEEISINEAIYRLNKHIVALEQFNKKNKILKLLPFKTTDNRVAFIDDVIEVSHGLLRICVKKMINEESLDPLFVVWRLFMTEYKDIDSEIFVKETAYLLFSIYKNIFVVYINEYNHSGNQDDKVSFLSESRLRVLQEMIILYNQIASLPLKELFDALDICLDQFLVIMNNYGIKENTGWGEWLKKYWWVPPIVITGILANYFSDLFGFRKTFIG